jgi:hypothetical protein
MSSTKDNITAGNQQDDDIEMADAPGSAESNQKEDDIENDNASDIAEFAFEIDSEGWISGSEVEDLDNDDFLGSGQGDGRSANKYPAGQDLASLRRQVGPPNRSNTHLLNGCYVEWRRDAFILTYESLRKMNARLQSRLVEMHSSGVDSAEYLYATKFLTKVLNASTTWLAILEERIETITDDTGKGGVDGPWDGKLVQKLVKRRTEDYWERVMHAEGVVKRAHGVGKRGSSYIIKNYTPYTLSDGLSINKSLDTFHIPT